MPTYMYRAVTKNGLIVQNRVEAANKQSLIKSLKGSQLMPIDVIQLRYASKNKKKTQKRNMVDINEIMKNVNTTSISVFTSISKKYPLYGHSIKKVWLTEQEFKKYHERNGGINATNQTFK